MALKKRGMCRQRQRWMGVMESEGIPAQQHWANTTELLVRLFLLAKQLAQSHATPPVGVLPYRTD